MHIDFVILINSFSQSLDEEKKTLTFVKMVIIKSLTYIFRLKSVCVIFLLRKMFQKNGFL